MLQHTTGCCLIIAAVSLVTLAAALKDDNTVKVFDGPDQVLELTKRDKWNNKGFNDYSHLRFGRGDPALTQQYDFQAIVPPFYPSSIYGSYPEKRASLGNDYNHLRFGRRVPSFTDYGHLRFG